LKTFAPLLSTKSINNLVADVNDVLSNFKFPGFGSVFAVSVRYTYKKDAPPKSPVSPLMPCGP
jgi:hypothetical protein